jgi:uncharacterized repeat protein (TIGR03833 family)
MAWGNPSKALRLAQNMNRGAQGRPWRGRGGNRVGGQSGRRGGSFATGDVPSAHQVLPGAGVSIVLKIDQPTGNEVQGIVGEVLGRGNHPRGIKVRLQDGRVGRVQRMVDQAIARDASEGLSNLGRDGEPNAVASTSDVNPPAVTSSRHFSDVRNDPYDYTSASTSREPMNLADYIKPSKNRRKKPASKENESVGEPIESNTAATPAPAVAIVTCPICGLFEGDEEAVAFHANTHFD